MFRSRIGRALLPYLLIVLIAAPIALILWDQLAAVATKEKIEWKNPWAFALFGGCALLAWVAFHLRARRAATFAYSRVGELALARPGLVSRLWSLPAVLRICAVGLIVCALARPTTYREEDVEVESIDIMVVLDLSKSMEERDLQRNRLDAGQRTIRNFLKRRDKTGEKDRIGLVVFAQSAMTQCPLTMDYRALDQIVADLSIGDVPEMGTAIGDALALSLASLRRSEAKSKVVILLSDGDSNWTTKFDPVEAKELAKKMNVKVFTILLGRERRRNPFGFRSRYNVNPQLLKEIAQETGGLYFRAGDDEALESSFAAVRKDLDKTRIRVTGRVPGAELFYFFLIPAIGLILLEILLGLTRWRRFP
jgi:Ca-activated chloride channel family protein